MDRTIRKESISDFTDNQNHYVKHLAEVNKHKEVIATEDILNEKGLLLTKKGSRIDNSASDRIIQHKLIKPLEEQVRLENSLDISQLNSDITSLTETYPDVKQIHDAHEFQASLDNLLVSCRLNPILLQELTVMRETIPEHYEKTLFCSWLSSLIATTLAKDASFIENTFIASLAHDIGLLHITPEVLRKKTPLTPEEWRTMQCHVVIGQLLIKRMYTEESPVARAILEHHERCDGSGYPAGKTDDTLDPLGQIVGIADSIQAIRINIFAQSGRTLGDIMPYLNMNKYTHFVKIHYAVRSIIMRSGLTPTNIKPYKTTGLLISHLIKNGRNLQNSVVILEHVLKHAKSFSKSSSCMRISNTIYPAVFMIESSGLVKDDIFSWLETLSEDVDQFILSDLIEMELMQRELYWWLRRICRVIKNCLESDLDEISEEYEQYLISAHETISEFLGEVS